MILTKEEFSIIQNRHFFELKQSALQKIETVFAALQLEIKKDIHQQEYDFPKHTDIEFGKISKGENYKGLPYRILDYPRLFKQDGIFAYRIMFWWGRGFYFTFHLSGKYLKPYLPKVETQFSKWQHQNVFYYHHHEEWEHEIAAPFYHPIENIHFKDLQQIGEQQGFVKFARQLEVLQIEKVKEVGLESFKLFLS
jgi:hypothetical protein